MPSPTIFLSFHTPAPPSFPLTLLLTTHRKENKREEEKFIQEHIKRFQAQEEEEFTSTSDF